MLAVPTSFVYLGFWLVEVAAENFLDGYSAGQGKMGGLDDVGYHWW